MRGVLNGDGVIGRPVLSPVQPYVEPGSGVVNRCGAIGVPAIGVDAWGHAYTGDGITGHTGAVDPKGA
jgi:hypothetical protein